MENRLRAELWRIAERYLGKEPMHGLPHMERVYANFKLFNPSNPDLSQILDSLETAVILHDIGRFVGGQVDHAAKSAEILKELFRGELSDVQNQDWILKAVAKHSIGLEGPVKNDGDMVLALLCVFDHMDCLGAIGIHRLTLFWSGGQPYIIPWIPQTPGAVELARKIKHYLSCPQEITREDMPMRQNSLLEALLYYYAATWHIRAPVRSILNGTEVEQEIEKRLALMKNYIKALSATLLLSS